jgi:hypothetical protein
MKSGGCYEYMKCKKTTKDNQNCIIYLPSQQEFPEEAETDSFMEQMFTPGQNCCMTVVRFL